MSDYATIINFLAAATIVFDRLSPEDHERFRDALLRAIALHNARGGTELIDRTDARSVLAEVFEVASRRFVLELEKSPLPDDVIVAMGTEFSHALANTLDRFDASL